MTLEKVDIHEVLHDTAVKKLEVVHKAIEKVDFLEFQVRHLETCGGNLSKFVDRYDDPEETLFKIQAELLKPENIGLSKRWDKAIAINKKIRMQLITNKALEALEGYKNLSITSSTADISFARAALFMCNTDEVKKDDRKTDTREDDQYAEVERSMETDDER